MSLFPDTLMDRLEAVGVVAGFSVDTVEQAVPIAQALIDGGLNVIELTLRTEAALDAVAAIVRDVPQMVVGVGTILTPQQAQKVMELGATFGVSPGLNPAVIKECKTIGLPFAPGIVTPTDLETAIMLDCRFVKFFPAETAGGIAYLRSMSAPYNHLGIRYFPLGGIHSENMSGYLAEPNVPAVGGSWIVKKDLVDKADWSSIELRAKEVRTALNNRKEK